MKMLAILCSLLTAISLHADTEAFVPVNGPVPAGLNPFSVTYSQSGRFAAAANYYSNNVSLYSVREKTGAFVIIDTVPVGSNPTFVAFSPEDKFAAVANSDSGGVNDGISVFKINQKTGLWLPIQTIDSAETLYPYSLAYSPNGKFLAVTNYNAALGFVSMYKVNKSGMLTLAYTQNNLLGPDVVVFSPDGRFLAVSNYDDASVSIFKINQDSGALAEIASSPFPVEVRPEMIAYQHDGAFVAIANTGSDSVSVYKVNKDTGELSDLQTIPSFNTRPFFVSFSKKDKLAAVGSFDTPGSAVIFCVDNGVWSASPVQTITNLPEDPRSIAFSPCEDFAAIGVFGQNLSPGFIQLYEVHESACSDTSDSSSSSSSSSHLDSWSSF